MEKYSLEINYIPITDITKFPEETPEYQRVYQSSKQLLPSLLRNVVCMGQVILYSKVNFFVIAIQVSHKIA